MNSVLCVNIIRAFSRKEWGTLTLMVAKPLTQTWCGSVVYQTREPSRLSTCTVSLVRGKHPAGKLTCFRSQS